ncbi:hypothetical protein, partial [Pseudomonas syringae group genomosp. 7]|uniref:hypothetical protein n=1 Tax=Pseudomonas syringae group genomosp. 7 TaxID=251699 RepID=UPI0037703E94
WVCVCGFVFWFSFWVSLRGSCWGGGCVVGGMFWAVFRLVWVGWLWVWLGVGLVVALGVWGGRL